MTISIKSAKAQDKTAELSDPYAPKAGKARAGLPFVIGTAILSLALYVKSMVKGTAEARGAPEKAPRHADADRPLHAEDDPSNATPADQPAQLTPAAPKPAQVNEAPYHFIPRSIGATLNTASVRLPRVDDVSNVVKLFPNRSGNGHFMLPEETFHFTAPHQGVVEPGQGRLPAVSSVTQPGVTPSQVNHPPVKTRAVYLSDLRSGDMLVITVASLLMFTNDADGDPLQVRNLQVSSGHLQLTPEGYLYTPDPDVIGPVQISYEITDGEYTLTQMAHFTVQPLVQSGDESDNTLSGTDAAEVIAGGGGDDMILAGGDADVVLGGDGDDVIHGGAGDDLLFGGQGADTIFGEDGDDQLHGDAGDDVLYGGGGNDELYGGEGQDVVNGDAGADRLYGGADDDQISGGAGDDALFGGAGNDALDGGEGDDLSQGGAGDDLLQDSSGSDTIEGGSGSDHIVAALDGCDDVFSGGGAEVPAELSAETAPEASHGGEAILYAFDGDEVDVLDYSSATQALNINLVTGQVSGQEVGTDTVEGFEVVISGQGDDQFILGRGNFVLEGGGGADRFDFTLTEERSTGQVSVFQILDFLPGDTVDTRRYQFFERSSNNENTSLTETEEDAPTTTQLSRVRISYEASDDQSHTVLELDDEDDHLVGIVTLNGHHLLMFHELS